MYCTRLQWHLSICDAEYCQGNAIIAKRGNSVFFDDRTKVKIIHTKDRKTQLTMYARLRQHCRHAQQPWPSAVTVTTASAEGRATVCDTGPPFSRRWGVAQGCCGDWLGAGSYICDTGDCTRDTSSLLLHITRKRTQTRRPYLTNHGESFYTLGLNNATESFILTITPP